MTPCALVVFHPLLDVFLKGCSPCLSCKAKASAHRSGIGIRERVNIWFNKKTLNAQEKLRDGKASLPPVFRVENAQADLARRMDDIWVVDGRLEIALWRRSGKVVVELHSNLNDDVTFCNVTIKLREPENRPYRDRLPRSCPFFLGWRTPSGRGSVCRHRSEWVLR